MFCRECHYDLRGQEEPRCPECGSHFDPRDGATYLRRPPTHLQSLLQIKWIRTCSLLLGVAVLYVTLVFLFVPGMYCSQCGSPSPRMLSSMSLRSIVTAQAIQSNDAANNRVLSLAELKPHLTPKWYSRSMEPRYVSANRWNRRLGDLIRWPVFSIGPALALIVLARRWLRKLAIAMACLCALATLLLFLSIGYVGRGTRTLSYAYLNDYVLVPGIEWYIRSRSSPNPMVAFEKQPWPGGRRLIARGSSQIDCVRENEFQRLLMNQPDAKTAWDECVAASECSTSWK